MLKIRYGDVNQKREFPFAESFSGIQAFSPELFKSAHEKFQEALKSGDAGKIKDASSMAVVVSGCLIRWKPLVAINQGYVEDWGHKNLAQWDWGIERRAAPSADDPAFIHCTTTGTSSLMAMIAQVVYEFKSTGAVSEKLATAFKRIRLNLCFNAAPEEIALVGQCDNIEQEQRKKHMEIDNILAVLSWHMSMASWIQGLDANSPLDLMRFVCCLL
jgi:hypothetical protein